MTQESERRLAKDRLYEVLADVSGVFGSRRRLELIDVLAQAPRNVERLASATNMSLANTSQHLQRLKHAGLVIDARNGTSVVYRLAAPKIAALWLQLRDLAAERNAEVERALAAYRPDRGRFKTVSIPAAIEAVGRGEAILVDVRPPEEYAAAHLPGAVNVPPDVAERWAAHAPPRQTVIAYCRGPFCRFADDALSLLADRGVAVARLETGVLEWQAAGAQEDGAEQRRANE